ncbi:histone deacetylase domain-containing protein [Hirsutella rhossiliensis]|uniref:Histone deacetylase domain-containing protein n=1 Tax=Hirsutella rhossiliensis TaxID=111463 RepID=A0A9P8SFI2_9HYPO|nr:histone deacetylase domain-containing protein [Hirsutella rhossiliensis]KAH0960963.1 histone deacetylase domain-containing protein [Hirsutella rhossiliensis]
MLSPSQATRRQSAANVTKDDDDDDGGLTQSLRELSLASQTANPDKSPRLQTASSPLQPSSSRRSSTTSARSQLPSRSPSNGRDSRASRNGTPRNGTPTLIRKASVNSLHTANGPAATLSASRRSSSARVMSPTTRAVMTAQEDGKPRPTAHSIARNHFIAELEALHGPESTLSTETIVILNDAVYGHRFSRPRTSRSALSTIVERPERIKASVLGISTAYVRLGGRHSHDRKLPLASPAVTNVHGTKWMEDLKLMCDSAESKLAMGGKELQRPESNRGSDAGPAQKLHEGDLYLCAETLEAIEGALGAVCDAVDAVFTSGHRRAFVGVRPPGHHCSASHPSGFCWVNNVHVGIMHAVLAHGLTHAAIIDFDLHHGDGSQAIAWQHNSRAVTASKNASAWKKTSIGYFSIHDINSYPCEMGDDEKVKNASLCIDNAHGQSVWNVHLESWKSDDEFWRLYDSKYTVLLEKTRKYLRQQADRLRASNQTPKAAIFFSAGFDASEWESVGMQRHQVNVPTDFYARLSRDVVKLAAEEDLHVDGRIISVLEGGYSDRALFSGIFSHLSGLVGDPVRTPGRAASGTDPGNSAVAEADAGFDRECFAATVHRHDPAWWASAELDKLERPPEPPSPPRKPRNSTPPTYSSPTQASTAKVVDPDKMRRSLSGLSTARPVSRPPSPPPPEVPWVVAAHELSKLIIPAGRQTDSCRPEDLNAEATRARRDRQSILMGILPPPPPEPSSRPTSRMALRGRKPKIIIPIDEEAVEQRPKSRRKTVGPLARAQSSLSNEFPSKTVNRRLSVSSTSVKAASQESPQLETVSNVDRPASATSSRSQGIGKLTVKRTRTTAASRKEAAPKASRAPKKSSSPARNGGAEAASAQASRPSTGPDAPSDDLAGAMDGITTGMKKIRINLITQSQREAKEKARLEAEKAASAASSDSLSIAASTGQPPLAGPKAENDDIPSVSIANGAGGVAEPAPATAPLSHQAMSSPSLQSPIEESSPPPMATPDPRQREPAQPESPLDVLRRNTQQSGNGGAMFIPYQPEGSTPVAVSQQEPLKWMPPNVPTPTANTPVATPSPAKRQDALFHYTSGIPFAPRLETGADQGLSSVWEVPETPQR